MKPETRTIFIADPLEVLKRMDSLQFDLVFLDTPLYGGYLFDLNDPKSPPYKTFEEYLAYVVNIISQSHRTLNQNGSILLRINPLSPFNPRLFLDRLFGKRNFRGEIVWENQATKHNPKSTPYINFESLLLYSKSESFVYNEQFTELSQDEIKQQYRHHDNRGFYKLWNLTDRLDRPRNTFEWNGIKPPQGQSWKYSRERLDQMDRDGELDRSGKFPKRKIYRSETMTQSPLGFVWGDLRRNKRLEKSIIDSRLKRAIEMVSKPESKLFDPFITPISLETFLQTDRHLVGVSQFEILSRGFPQLKSYPVVEIKLDEVQDVAIIDQSPLSQPVQHLIESESRLVDPKIIIETHGQKCAFVVGINSYKDGIPHLQYCVNDAIELDQTLKNNGYRVKMLHDDMEDDGLVPTRSNIDKELYEWVRSLNPDDTLYVHFSCHGAIIDGNAMIITSDTRVNREKNTALYVNDIIEIMKRGHAKKLVLSLDICHGGIEMGRAFIDQEFVQNVYENAEGFVLLAASTAQQVAYEIDEFQHGLFSYYLIRGFCGDADQNFDGWISVDDIKNYALNAIRIWSTQHDSRQDPTYKSEGIGEIILVQPQ